MATSMIGDKPKGGAVPGRGFLRLSVASSCFLSLALLLAVMAVPSWAAVYKVGGSAGWSEDVNYTSWEISRSPFSVGDTIVFQYDKKLHSVEEVSKAAYHRCSTRSSVATHSTGNDHVILDKAGHRYFICATHCSLGQKLHVTVTTKSRSSAAAKAPAPALFPAPSPSPSSSSAAPAAPSKTSLRPPGSGINASAGATAPAPLKNVAAHGATAWEVVLLAVVAGVALQDLVARRD